VRRREFIRLIGGAALWPLAALAQQAEPMRRIGVLLNLAADDPETAPRLQVFLRALQELGWREGVNLRLDYRWSVDDPDRARTYAAELIALNPDVILVHGSPIMRQVQRVNRNVPVVFVSVADPVGGGFVATLARPGGNSTGFTNLEYSLAGKWLELLKQIMPQLRRAAVIRNADEVSGGGQFGAIQALVPSLGVELLPIDPHDAGEIEHSIAKFASQPDGGLIVTATALAAVHRQQIIALAAQYRLPTIYPYRFFVVDGGLLSYGPDTIDQYRRAAGYVDRILKGEKPADLPVQTPTNYETVVNLKTAKALGLAIPQSILAIADVIE
jgi:putative ABC transport system substrate-binding protein